MGIIERIKEALVPQRFREALRENEELRESLGLREGENLGDVASGLLEAGWLPIGAGGLKQITLSDIKVIVEMARVFFIKNPLVRRSIRLLTFYTFGRGVDIKSDDKATGDVIAHFLEVNAAKLGPVGITETSDSLSHDGNVFYILFVDESTGEVLVRTRDPLEIVEIITNPEDASEPWFYHFRRSTLAWNLETGTSTPSEVGVWYPSTVYFDKNPLKIPAKIGTDTVQQRAACYHVKTGSIEGWTYGLPDCFSTIDWARSYKNFLTNWATLQSALSRWAVRITTPGGQKAMRGIKTRLDTGLALDNNEDNPSPNTGSTWIGGPSQKIEAFKGAGAATAPSEAREMKLMVSAGSGFPEHMFGDVSTGNLATSRTLDRPTELMVLHQQKLWVQVLSHLLQFALGQSANRANGKLKEANVKPDAIQFQISFPDILENDTAATIGALIDTATMKGQSFGGGLDPRTFMLRALQELNIRDAQKVIDDMYPPGSYNPDEWAAIAPEAEPVPDPTTGLPPVPGVKQPKNGKTTMEALLRKIHEAITARKDS